MTDVQTFLATLIGEARNALFGVWGRANLHLWPDTIPRPVYRRARKELRRLEIAVRRMIMLLALTLDIDAATARKDGAPQPSGNEAAPVDSEIAALLPVAPASHPGALALMPGQLVICVDSEETASVPFPSIVKPSGPISVGGLKRQIARIAAVLRAPDAHAERLARRMAETRQPGILPPVLMPLAGRARLYAPFEDALPALNARLKSALSLWADTG